MSKKKEEKNQVSKDEEAVGEITIDEGDTPTTVVNGEFAKEQKDESVDWKSQYLYLKAEFDNFRKNSIKERSDLIKYGAERFIVRALTVIDTLDLALESEINESNYNDFRQGVEMTANEFRGMLKDLGVNEVNPMGAAFDPTQHEALGSEASSEVTPGHVTRVFKKAYKLHDRVIRPAQVMVAKEVPKETPANEE